MALFRTASAQELVDFSKHLSVMLKSGITINEALGELSDQAESKRFRTLLLRVKQNIESGTSLSDTFNREKRAFGGTMIAVIKAGEASGTLEDNLAFLADWLEHNADIRREVHGAMIYPAIVFIATILMSGALALLVLPRLLPIFSQMGGELPGPTKFLLALTSMVQDYWYLLAIALGALFFGFVFLSRLSPVERFLDRAYLRVPFMGSMLMKYQLTLIGQLFTTLFRSGLSISEIIDIAADGATNATYRDAMRHIGEEIRKGASLSASMRAYPRLFPRNMLSIVAIGEKSGTLEDSFAYMTEYYRKEVYAATKRIPTVIEPLLLLVMGAMVAFIAIAIIMPIYEFTSHVRK